jgi:hemolysin-activating ACP:hemolysin acyltransferase
MPMATDTAPGASAARPVAPGGRLEARTLGDPATALGIAASYLMTRPAFARLAFGHWTRVLAGQINRGHYVFVYEKNEVVGFAGWALANAEDAQAWLDRDSASPPNEGRSGDCIVVNAWAASTPGAHRVLVDHVQRVAAGKRAVYAKRIYRDRRSRPLRRVNQLAQQHHAAAAAAAAAAERPDVQRATS